MDHESTGHRPGCHVGGVQATVGETSTGYFVLGLCLVLVLVGLLVLGVIPSPFG